MLSSYRCFAGLKEPLVSSREMPMPKRPSVGYIGISAGIFKRKRKLLTGNLLLQNKRGYGFYPGLVGLPRK